MNYLAVLRAWRSATTYGKRRMHSIEEDGFGGPLAASAMCGLPTIRIPFLAGDKSLAGIPNCQNCKRAIERSTTPL